jgi:DNA-directed RNA polymerase subunit alpha
MRIRWRGIELPSRVVLDTRSATQTYARFVIEPFERGFGTTVGNSLRRILLSSLEGAAVTSIKVAKVQHEFMTLPGVLEDVSDIILNVKRLIVRLDSDEPRTMRLAAQGPGEITADLIEADPAVTILNKDLVIATLTEAVDFDMELRVQKGRGYVPASEWYEQQEEQEIGLIPVDAIFSPVQRVRYKTEDTRVGQKTNYDKLTLEVWTNGSISASVDDELIRKLNMPVGDLELSVRASNCLESARINTVADLVARDESDLLKVRSFGKTSLREVKRKLTDLGLTLGMTLPDGVHVTAPDASESGSMMM